MSDSDDEPIGQSLRQQLQQLRQRITALEDSATIVTISSTLCSGGEAKKRKRIIDNTRQPQTSSKFNDFIAARTKFLQKKKYQEEEEEEEDEEDEDEKEEELINEGPIITRRLKPIKVKARVLKYRRGRPGEQTQKL